MPCIKKFTTTNEKTSCQTSITILHISKSVNHRYTPGGHTSQICLPLEEELVKVPRGQGRKRDTVSLEDAFLNPEDKRMGAKTFVQKGLVCSLRAIASSSEF